MRNHLVMLCIPIISLLASQVVYAKKDEHKQLPPGLQKKVAKGKALPPGWQKKLQVGTVIEPEIYEQGVIVERSRDGIITIEVDGKWVRLMEHSKEIVEILKH
ncbi:hypothetical protein QWY77_05755 [Thalassotalea ponticola]|uniref:hypothetical protein n=1 Tax=Thalassotalea ponticola TaxID=1523392 RepID=UPI0025B3226E|nr:hypothetical protein [Thalassotalea ponticola]MDN3652263.1 hypothetical protein [Thalassotalea ponticola]